MMFGLIVSLFVRIFDIVYRWLDQNVIVNVLNFIKGFEQGIIIISAILFLLITIYVTIKHIKKLPQSYIIEITDIYNKKTAIDGLRLIFATYDAAESYARFYRNIFGEQYKFRVIGISIRRDDEINIIKR